MKFLPADLNALIRSRRSIFPASYVDREIPRAIIEQILENANWAPNHRHTEPWRFKIFTGAARQRLGEFLANYYETHTAPEKFSPMKLKKTMKKPLQSACVIAICMQRDPAERVPEWEELAATACAVQNMWLSCTAYDIGCYWSSPKAIQLADQLFPLAAGEKCLGFLYMGYHQMEAVPGKRTTVAEKLVWFED